MNRLYSVRFLAGLLLVFLLNENVQAQHSHGRRNTVELELQTEPYDDQVLELAPEILILRFTEYVSLVKLTLKVEDMEPIDIGFQFSTAFSRVFIQMIPELESAKYYTAEWAALTSENVVAYGSFLFSFGSDAKKPSSIIDSRVFPDSPF
jgi:methionine-rich copper-binding protein CopC